MYSTDVALDRAERAMEPPVPLDHVEVYPAYVGGDCWRWRIERNGCGRSSSETFRTRDQAVRAAWVVAKSNGLPFVSR